MTGLYALESTPLVTTRWRPSTFHAKAYLRTEETRNLNIHFVDSRVFRRGRMSIMESHTVTVDTDIEANEPPEFAIANVATWLAEDVGIVNAIQEVDANVQNRKYQINFRVLLSTDQVEAIKNDIEYITITTEGGQE